MLDAMQRQMFLACLAGDLDCAGRGFIPIAGWLYAPWTRYHYGRSPLEPRKTWW